MKIRLGFVSNSSSTDFEYDEDEADLAEEKVKEMTAAAMVDATLCFGKAHSFTKKDYLTQLKWQQQGMYDAAAIVRRAFGPNGEGRVAADILQSAAKSADGIIARVQMDIEEGKGEEQA